LSLVTDYDAGLEGHPEVRPVSVEDVVALFGAGIGQLRQLILDLIPGIPAERNCPCATAMSSAFIHT
jgi:5'-methylthioadenosine phosphorylase